MILFSVGARIYGQEYRWMLYLSQLRFHLMLVENVESLKRVSISWNGLAPKFQQTGPKMK